MRLRLRTSWNNNQFIDAIEVANKNVSNIPKYTMESMEIIMMERIK
ncbi:MAG: hypothetical protein ACP5RZ_03195 [Thermoplasmata archaeon]